MKAVITILIILGFLWVYKQIFDKYERVKKESDVEQTSPERPVTQSSSALPGMPESLESSLDAAQKQGADGLAQFLRQYRHAIRDPRLAAIELDYVVLVSLKDPNEARRVFRSVQERTPPASPVYQRVKRLEKTYQ